MSLPTAMIRLPGEWPDWLGPDRLILITTTLIGLWPAGALLVSFPFALLYVLAGALLASRLLIRQRDPQQLGTAAGALALVTPLCTGALSLATCLLVPSCSAGRWGGLVATVLGVLAALQTLLQVVVCAAVCGFTLTERTQQAVEAGDRSLMIAGAAGTTAAVSVHLLLLQLGLAELAGMVLWSVLPCAGLSMFAAHRLGRWPRWIERVRAGNVPGWELRPLPPEADPVSLRPLGCPSSAAGPELVQTVREGALVPVARVG